MFELHLKLKTLCWSFYVLLCGGNFEVPILYLTCEQKRGSIAINRKVKAVTEKVQFWLFVFTEKQTKKRQINEVGGWKRNTLPLVYTFDQLKIMLKSNSHLPAFIV